MPALTAILGTLTDGRYDATVDGQVEEWPPHPARVFQALVAAAEGDADRDALRWLEGRDAPDVWACGRESTARLVSQSYVVTNDATGKGSSPAWPGRTAVLRTRNGLAVADPSFAVVWHDEAPAAVAGALGNMTRRVPYLGRTTSAVSLRLSTVLDPGPTWRCYRPGDPYGSGTPLRVPSPGYLGRLEAAYRNGDRRIAVRTLPYAPWLEPAPASVAAASPFQSPIVFGVERGQVTIAGERYLDVAARLRRAVMARVGLHFAVVPPVVCGHFPNGSLVPDGTTCAYLALPNVGGSHADGHVLAVGIALPAGIDQDQRRAIVRALIEADGGLGSVSLGSQVQLAVSHDPGRTDPRGALPQRWTGGAEGSRTWLTATPVMLHRRPRPNESYSELVAACARHAGYPTPEQVEIGPSLHGAPPGPRRGSLPARRMAFPVLHARIRFAEPVQGPVLIGANRCLGSGLCAPVEP